MFLPVFHNPALVVLQGYYFCLLQHSGGFRGQRLCSPEDWGPVSLLLTPLHVRPGLPEDRQTWHLLALPPQVFAHGTLA